VIRRAALKFSIPYVTTVAGALAVSKAVAALKDQALTVCSLQEYHDVAPAANAVQRNAG
jgi:carbamoyl-phosphate synthase large subunit